MLRENSARWTEEFLASGKARPEPRRYAHRDIVRALAASSHGKCFYCERAIPEGEGQVDHHVPVAERPDLAYAWTNLYWSCKDCNQRKLPEGTVPRAGCVDPCDPGTEPAEHLTFTDEYLFPRRGSELGRSTIQKYHLNRLDLQNARNRVLRDLFGLLSDRRVARSDAAAREILDLFADPSRPFSLMVRCLVERLAPGDTAPAGE